MRKREHSIGVSVSETITDTAMVSVTVTGNKDVKAIVINPACVDPDDVEMLQDLVLSAVNEALRTATKTVEDEIGKITGGLGLGF